MQTGWTWYRGVEVALTMEVVFGCGFALSWLETFMLGSRVLLRLTVVVTEDAQDECFCLPRYLVASEYRQPYLNSSSTMWLYMQLLLYSLPASFASWKPCPTI
jgi:hypothetical protein